MPNGQNSGRKCTSAILVGLVPIWQILHRRRTFLLGARKCDRSTRSRSRQAVGEVVAIEVGNPLRIDIAIDAAGSLFGNDGHLDVERVRAELDTAETDLDAVFLFDGSERRFEVGADFGEVVLGELFDLLGHLGFLIS